MSTATLNKVQIGFLGEAIARSLDARQLAVIADRIAERLMEQKQTSDRDYMTAQDVAKKVHKTPKTILRRRAVIPDAIRGPKGWLFPRESVMKAIGAGLF